MRKLLLSLALLMVGWHAEAYVIFRISGTLKSYNETHATIQDSQLKRAIRLPRKGILLAEGQDLSQLLDRETVFRVEMSNDMIELFAKIYKGTTVLSTPLPKESVKPKTAVSTVAAKKKD